jgi:hypothetical protein
MKLFDLITADGFTEWISAGLSNEIPTGTADDGGNLPEIIIF